MTNVRNLRRYCDSCNNGTTLAISAPKQYITKNFRRCVVIDRPQCVLTHNQSIITLNQVESKETGYRLFLRSMAMIGQRKELFIDPYLPLYIYLKVWVRYFK